MSKNRGEMQALKGKEILPPTQNKNAEHVFT